jgi:hypothetical protein
MSFKDILSKKPSGRARCPDRDRKTSTRYKYKRKEVAMKIFVRERRKVDKGEKKPRFRVAGVSGGDIKLYVNHMRKKELDQLAAATSAEIVYLQAVKDGKGKGKRKAAASA